MSPYVDEIGYYGQVIYEIGPVGHADSDVRGCKEIVNLFGKPAFVPELKHMTNVILLQVVNKLLKVLHVEFQIGRHLPEDDVQLI